VDRQVAGQHPRRHATDAARGQREGIALVAVILLGTALVLLAHVAVVLGLALEKAARADVAAAEIDALLDSRLTSVREGMTSLHDSLPAGIDGRLVSPELLRLSADSAGRGRIGLVWALDPQTRLDALGAGVRMPLPSTTIGSGRIAGSAADSCAPGLVVPTGFRISSVSPWYGETPLSVGPLDRSDWIGLPDPPPGGSPVPSAWFTDESLTLGPGSWRGLVLVDGTLELVAGADVRGWVAVTGDLILRDGATVHGVARVGGTVAVDPGGVIEVAPCGAVQTVHGLPDFAFPVAIGATAWPADPFD
jgi:hypothetical protein